MEENTTPGTVIFQVRATDADYGDNSIITYSLLPSEYATKFSINASSGNIKVIGILDRENKSEVTLRINATDGTFSVTSELFVIITDANDNGPIFKNCEAPVLLQEPAPPQTQLFHVSTTDADSGSNAIIKYSIVKNEEGACSYLYIDQDGNVYSNNSLSWETTCNVTIRASDGNKTIECVVDLRVAMTPGNTEGRTGELKTFFKAFELVSYQYRYYWLK